MVVAARLSDHGKAWWAMCLITSIVTCLGGCYRHYGSISELTPTGASAAGDWYDIEFVKEPTPADPTLVAQVLNYPVIDYGKMNTATGKLRAVSEQPQPAPGVTLKLSADGRTCTFEADRNGTVTVDFVRDLGLDFFDADRTTPITVSKAPPGPVVKQERSYLPSEFLHAYYFFRAPSRHILPDGSGTARTEAARLYPVSGVTDAGQYLVAQTVDAPELEGRVEPDEADPPELIGYAASEHIAMQHASLRMEVDVRFVDGDADGVLTGGEEGALHVTVTNRSPLQVHGASVAIGGSTVPAGLAYTDHWPIAAVSAGGVSNLRVPVAAAEDIPSSHGWVAATVEVGGVSFAARTQITTRLLAKPELVLSGWRVEGQDTTGQLRAGETHDLRISLINQGSAAATSVALYVGTAEPPADAAFPSAAHGDVPASSTLDASAETGSIVIHVGAVQAGATREIAFALSIPEENGARDVTLHLLARCCDGHTGQETYALPVKEALRPVLEISHEVMGGLCEDQTARLGEPVEVRVVISNRGNATAETVVVEVRPSVPHVTPQRFAPTLQSIGPGAQQQFVTTVEAGVGFMPIGILEQAISVVIEASTPRAASALAELGIVVRRPRPAEIHVVEVRDDGRLVLDAGRAGGIDAGLKGEVYFDLGVIAEIEMESADMTQAVAVVTSAGGGSTPQAGDFVRILPD
jgi:hypothetical protein